MREMAEYVRSQGYFVSQDTEEKFDTMTVVSLDVPGRNSSVVLSFHHSFPKNRSWVQTAKWDELTMAVMDGSLNSDSAGYAAACESFYWKERSVV